MENSAEAFKMAFAVMVFVMALSIAIMTFSQARETADIVLSSSDADTLYEYEVISQENRIVGMETIIPTLYRYSKESLMIRFTKNNGVCDAVTGKITGNYGSLLPLELYQTTTNESTWARAYKGYIDDDDNVINPSYSYSLGGDHKKISVIDLTEEQQRGESWTGSTASINKHLDEVIVPFLTSNYNNKQFIELVGRINQRSGNKTTTKTVITYVLIN